MIRYRCGISDINEMSIWVWLWDLGYRYGIWDVDLGDDSIDSVIQDIDRGYLVTLVPP